MNLDICPPAAALPKPCFFVADFSRGLRRTCLDVLVSLFPIAGWRDKGEDGEGCFQELSDSVVVREPALKTVFLVCVQSRHHEPAPLGLSDLTVL